MPRRPRIFLVALALAAVPTLPLATGADAAPPPSYDSGYVTTSQTTSYNVARTSWAQPAGTCTSVDSGARFWVGVGGLDGSPAAWTGTDTDCSGGSPVYYGWYRPPGTSDHVPYGNAISAGDLMVAVVSCTSTSCTFQLSDMNANWTASTTQPLSGTPHSAEAMISRNGALPLTNFGTVWFTPVAFNDELATSSSALPLVITSGGRALDSISELSTWTNPYTSYTINFFSGTWNSAT